MTTPEYPFPSIRATRKQGDEPFHAAGTPLAATLLSFWQWSTSNLLDNTVRGVLAEFLVAQALGCAGGVRQEWTAYDLTSPSGVKVEVKSAAYLQSWSQKQPSVIRFSVSEAFGWDSETNLTPSTPGRAADVYVFCLLAHADQENIDPLDVSQWRFYVVPTARLNSELGTQRSIGLSTLENRLQARPIKYEELVAAVAAAANAGKNDG
jgi:hypothetical protein